MAEVKDFRILLFNSLFTEITTHLSFTDSHEENKYKNINLHLFSRSLKPIKFFLNRKYKKFIHQETIVSMVALELPVILL